MILTLLKQADYDQCFVFRDLKLITDPMIYEFSDIDVSNNYAGDPALSDYLNFPK